MRDLYERLFSENSVFVLFDPDRMAPGELARALSSVEDHPKVRGILVGTSLLATDGFDRFVREIKAQTRHPVVLFPGNFFQLSPAADGIFFLSLISGRNPQYLIGEQVKAALMIKRMGLCVIPVAYLLVESGKTTAVEFMSSTKPIPRDKVDILLAHAVAAELLGFRAIYLEAGSGALAPVPREMVEAVAKEVRIPVIVGGGIRTREEIETYWDAGARSVVVGTLVEEEGTLRI